MLFVAAASLTAASLAAAEPIIAEVRTDNGTTGLDGGLELEASAILPDHTDLDSPVHDYWGGTPDDPFTRLLDRIVEGSVVLDASSELAYLRSLLDALDIPVSSQTLVFSTTSLQLRLISPSNPRALYFNENVYVGYIPGGRVEIVSLDPARGGIFHIFDFPSGPGILPRIERSNRCMNCHADESTGYLPGLVLKSVLPGPRGGSLDAFRRGESGHAIPLGERLGGWYVTGADDFDGHHGNRIGRSVAGSLSSEPLLPGESFDWGRYPVATSDLLAHLIHEHQIGFINRAIEAAYRTRTYLAEGAADGAGGLSPEAEAELDRQARILVRYLLFADEAPLPAGGIRGDETFRGEFLSGRRASSAGHSLRDLDLTGRLFLHRCSYMIYSLPFEGLPPEMKRRVYRELSEALAPAPAGSAPTHSNHLAPEEKAVIRAILSETLPPGELPSDW